MGFQNIRNEVQKSDDPYWNKVSACFVDGLKRYVENKHLLPVPEKDILQEMYLALRTDDIKGVFGEIENGLFDDDLKQYRQWVMIATVLQKVLTDTGDKCPQIVGILNILNQKENKNEK